MAPTLILLFFILLLAVIILGFGILRFIWGLFRLGMAIILVLILGSILLGVFICLTLH